MKVETCMFSGLKIAPGHGKRMVKADGKVMIFLSSKCERSYKLKKNPRKVNWTVLYRRKHKKGTQAEETTKKRSRKAVKFSRPIGETSLADIIAKKTQRPEFRKQQREQAIKAAKEATRAVKSAKKTEKTKTAKTGAVKQKTQKVMKTAAPRVGGKR